MMPVGENHVIGFYDHPKLIHISTGRVVHRWRDIRSGQQKGSIVWRPNVAPQIALDTVHRRFAVASEKSIAVVQLPLGL
jgi:hypothetical protein